MRTIILMFLLVIGTVHAQTYEVGLFAGGANVIGDVGRTNYLLPTGPAYGGVFKWNKSKRYAYRASIIKGNVVNDDARSNLSSRVQRGFRVENSVVEYSLGMEFHFVEYNLHKLGPAFTPYLYTGVTYFRYDFNYIDALQVQDINQKDGSFAIPMTVGAKYRLSQFLILGAEIGARYTLTDNLDASNPEGSNFEQFRFGNVFSDDWYVFSGITLTYTFGRKPCQDCFE
ncbi:Inorganic polyphosphate/ATP-NAD kinase [Croceitalea dokdonensis DOKDO 023]|uniref:Inorganic polyphosphate/ATP-NAD kinase n=1 Tax=Croceitalea dokdonensis DOKDO 023 TaxID=1300341 RepID=A0A0P7B2H9_9FLAO|nr:DUF6089 family protein [Croceitalea dokdonensis]KPM32461.1 Inorganic polyphosphate/ATP-NAD kinase [Croceitalea dokdonensis DOKDO 023]